MRNKKQRLAPKLRFPEFRERSEWILERMGRLYSFMGNNALARDKLNYSRGSVKNVHYGDIHTKYSVSFDITKESVPYINPTERLPPFSSEDYCIEGDLIFADASEDMNDVGKSIEIVHLNGERLLAGQHTVLARPNDGRLAVGFAAHLFRSDGIRAQIQREAQGTKVYAISATRLANVQIAFPRDAKEQRQIANCFTALDQVIAAQARKVEALKAHKNGLMQQLLPREGELIPRLRLKNFKHDRKWRLEKVSDLMRKVSVPVVVNPDATYREIGVRSHGKGVFHKEAVTGRALGSKRVFRVKKNAFVVNIVFAWEQAVATTTESDDGMIASHRFPMYVPKQGRCDIGYVKNFFLTKRGKHLLGIASPGGAGRNKTLGQKEFEKLEIAVPETVAEQTDIAECLSAADDIISAEATRLEILKEHRKGLMQQMFPSPDGTEA